MHGPIAGWTASVRFQFPDAAHNFPRVRFELLWPAHSHFGSRTLLQNEITGDLLGRLQQRCQFIIWPKDKDTDGWLRARRHRLSHGRVTSKQFAPHAEPTGPALSSFSDPDLAGLELGRDQTEEPRDEEIEPIGLLPEQSWECDRRRRGSSSFAAPSKPCEIPYQQWLHKISSSTSWSLSSSSRTGRDFLTAR